MTINSSRLTIGLVTLQLVTSITQGTAKCCRFNAVPLSEMFAVYGCFAAGTQLLTPDGLKLIERLRPGDFVLARSEFEASGRIQPKVVEETFRRFGRIWHVKVQGKIIRTTMEHPFYVFAKGWVEASLLKPGDLLLSHDNKWIAVEEVFDSGVCEIVYNVRVADYHTYFVSDARWGFSVWAHNLRSCADVLGLSEGGPGQWGISPRRTDGIEYQELITNVERGAEYRVGSTWFDGYDARRNVLLDAKDWRSFILPDVSFWRDTILKEANDQVAAAAASGTRIEWWFSTQQAADAVSRVLRRAGITQIEVKVGG